MQPQSPYTKNQQLSSQRVKVLSPLIPQAGLSPNAATAIISDIFTMAAPNWKGAGASPNSFSFPFSLDMNTKPEANTQLFEFPAVIDELPSYLDASPVTFHCHDTKFLLEPVAADLRLNPPAPSSMNTLFSPLDSDRPCDSRQLSHRESERRRRKSLKSTMDLLESLVLIAVDRTGNSPINQKGRNKGIASKRLSHAEIYQLAREMLIALKTEIAWVRSENMQLMAENMARHEQSL